MPPTPTWLQNDDGTPLPGIRTAGSFRIWVNQTDGAHAAVNGIGDLYKQLAAWASIDRSEVPNVINGKREPFVFVGKPGLNLNKCSWEDGIGTPLTSASKVTGDRLAALRSAWTSPTAPVMNFLPTGDAKVSQLVPVVDCAETVYGVSIAPNYWLVFAGIAYCGMRVEVADSLQASGTLCSTIDGILRQFVGKEFLVAGQYLPDYGVFQPSEKWPKGSPNPPSLEQQVRDARTIARLANAITLTPQPTPFESFRAKVGAKVTDADAEKFWLMYQAVKN